MSQGAVRAGAAYEAILVDKVTDKTNQIIASLDRLKAAFDQINPAAATLNTAMGGIGTAMQQAASASTRGTNAMQQISKVAMQMSLTVSRAGQAVGQAMIHIGNQMRMAGLAATGAATGIAYALYRATRAASDATETFNQFNQVFGENAAGIDEWANDFAKNIGRSVSATRKGLATFQSFFVGMGFGANEAAEMSKQMQRLAVDFGSFFNVADEEALRRFLGGLAGQSENLLKFGINVQEMALAEHELAKALGIATSEMTQQQKTAIRYAILTEKMQELSAEGDALRTAFEFENQIKRLGAAFERLQVRIGTVVKEGIGKDLVQAFNAIFTQLQNLPAERINQLIGFTAVLGAAGGSLIVLGTALAALGPPLLAATTLIASLFGLVAALTMAGPVGLAVTAVGALVAAIAGLFAYGIITSFPLQEAIERLGDTFSKTAENAKMAIRGITDAIRSGDLDTAWEIARISGEIAFRRLAEDIRVLLKEAIISGVEEAVSLLPGVLKTLAKYSSPAYWLSQAPGAAIEALQGEFSTVLGDWGGALGDPVAQTPAQQRIAELETYQAGLAAAMEASVAAVDAFTTGLQVSAKRDFRPGMTSDGEGVETEIRRLVNQVASVGSASAMFARNAGQFAPVLDTQFKKIENNQDKQLDEQKQTTKQVEYVKRAIEDLGDQTLVFQ